jgi:hypothetical protein
LIWVLGAHARFDAVAQLAGRTLKLRQVREPLAARHADLLLD